jgi:heme-degrading monooxygenase HmoA
MSDPIWAVIWWEVKPEHQQELAEAIRETRHLAKKTKGFIRATVVQSRDGKRILVAARWNSEAAYRKYIRSAEYAKAAQAMKKMIDDGRATYEAHIGSQVAEVHFGVG